MHITLEGALFCIWVLLKFISFMDRLFFSSKLLNLWLRTQRSSFCMYMTTHKILKNGLGDFGLTPIFKVGPTRSWRVLTVFCFLGQYYRCGREIFTQPWFKSFFYKIWVNIFYRLETMYRWSYVNFRQLFFYCNFRMNGKIKILMVSGKISFRSIRINPVTNFKYISLSIKIHFKVKN